MFYLEAEAHSYPCLNPPAHSCPAQANPNTLYVEESALEDHGDTCLHLSP